MKISKIPPGSWRIAGSLVLGLGLLTLFAIGLLVLGLALPGNALAKNDDRWEDTRRQGRGFHWSGRIARGNRLEVHGIHGNIKVRLASGSQVVVDGKKSARRSDPESVEIEVSEQDGNVLVCARYPRPDGGLNDCGENQQVNNNDVAINFDIQVPPGVHVDVRTVNGGVEALGLEGDVVATTVNGSVRVSTTGGASATTVNGSVLAKVGRMDEDVDFTTVNGRVRVEVPQNANATVRARTMHGQISTDFPLTVRGRTGSRRMTGEIGRGGPQIRIETVNGQIELLSSGERSWSPERFPADRRHRDYDDHDDDHDHDEDEDDDGR